MNKHMHTIGLSDTKSSRFCGLEEETACHVICCCDALAKVPSIWSGPDSRSKEMPRHEATDIEGVRPKSQSALVRGH